MRLGDLVLKLISEMPADVASSSTAALIHAPTPVAAQRVLAEKEEQEEQEEWESEEERAKDDEEALAPASESTGGV